jgi:dTDP-glucose pyrophosphorylase
MDKHNYKKLIIKESISLKDAMKALSLTAKKILFVVNENQEFVGTLNDGDIRRWILKGGNLDANITDVVFRRSYSVSELYSVRDVKTMMKKLDIEFVPVLNKERKIVEMLYYEHLFQQPLKKQVFKKLDIPIVVMAGGKGSRLDPFTKILPKPLIPIGDKTILEIIFNKFIPYSVDHFYLSVNYKAGIIKAYLEELKPQYAITYLEEDKPLGTAGSLFQLNGKVQKPILITNCDIIIDANYTDLLKHHRKENNDITIVASVKDYTIPYGVCEVENGGKLKEIREKPAFSFLINTGMYILSPNMLNLIPKNIFFHITDLMEKVQEVGGSIGVYPIGENAWIDTGEWDEYKKAVGKLSS